MSLFVLGRGGGGRRVSRYNSMLYMIGRRLNNCHFKLALCVHMLYSFLSPMLSYFPVLFMVTGQCVDYGSPDR